jgi:hypothetical protein
MAAANKDTIKTLTTHDVDGAFVDSHGGDVMDMIKPSACSARIDALSTSWPCFSRPSTSCPAAKTWMRGTSPRMTERLQLSGTCSRGLRRVPR